MKEALICITVLFTMALQTRAQSINGTWVSSDSSTCINFDSTKHKMTVRFWVEKDWIPVSEKFVYKIKNDTLRVVYKYEGRKASTSYKIVFLLDGKINLSIIGPVNYGTTMTITNGSDLVYKKFNTCKSCRQ